MQNPLLSLVTLLALFSLTSIAYPQEEPATDSNTSTITQQNNTPKSYSQFLAELTPQTDSACNEICQHAKAADSCAIKLYEEEAGSTPYIAAEKCFRTEHKAVNEVNSLLAAQIVIEHKELFAVIDPELLSLSLQTMLNKIELTPSNLAYIFNALIESRAFFVKEDGELMETNHTFRLSFPENDQSCINYLKSLESLSIDKKQPTLFDLTLFKEGTEPAGTSGIYKSLFWLFLVKVQSLLKNQAYVTHWNEERVATLQSVYNYFFTESGIGKNLGAFFKCMIQEESKIRHNPNTYPYLVNKDIIFNFIQKQNDALAKQKTTLKEKLKTKLEARKAQANS